MFGFLKREKEQTYSSSVMEDFLCQCGGDRFSLVFRATITTNKIGKWKALCISSGPWSEYPDLECIKCRTLYNRDGEILHTKEKKPKEVRI